MKSPFLFQRLKYVFTRSLCLPAILVVSTVGRSAAEDAFAEKSDEDRFGSSVLVFEPDQRTEPIDRILPCQLGTHDSCPDQRVNDDPVAETLATIAASVGSRFGVSVQQMVEPFAMVGPDACSTLDEIAGLMKYWSAPYADETEEVVGADPSTDSISDDADADVEGTSRSSVEPQIVSLVPFVDFGRQLETNDGWASPLASAAMFGFEDPAVRDDDESIDWQSHDDATFGVVVIKDVMRPQHDTPELHGVIDQQPSGQEVTAAVGGDAAASKNATVSEETRVAGSRVEQRTAASTDANGSEVPSSNQRLVGCSGMIATLDQTVSWFDLTAGDDHLRNFFPAKEGDYCLVQRNELHFRDLDRDGEEKATVSLSRFTDPTCLLDESIWDLQQLLDRKSKFRRSLRVKRMGRELGRFVSSATKSTSRYLATWFEIGGDSRRDPIMSDKRLVRDGVSTKQKPNAAPRQVDQVRVDQFLESVARLWASSDTARSLAGRLHHWYQTVSNRQDLNDEADVIASAEQQVHR